MSHYHYCLQLFVKKVYFYKYLYYRLVVCFRLVDVSIVKYFLKNRIYNTLTNYKADFLKYILADIRVLYKARVNRDEVLDIFFNKHVLCKHCPYWLINESC